MIPVARNEVGAYAISAAHVSMIHCVPHSRTYIRAPGIDESECYIRMGCSWGAAEPCVHLRGAVSRNGHRNADGGTELVDEVPPLYAGV